MTGPSGKPSPPAKKSRFYRPKVTTSNNPPKSTQSKSSAKSTNPSIPTSSKGSEDTQTSPTRSKLKLSAGKAKRPRSPTPLVSNTHGTTTSRDEISKKGKEDVPRPLKPSLSQKSQGSGSKKLKVSFSFQSEGSENQQSSPNTSRPPDGMLPEPSPNMNIGNVAVDDHQMFARYFGSRPFCPIVYVDLLRFKEHFNFDMSPWLSQFMPLLSISKPYSPEVVRVFYHNMRVQEKAHQSDEDVLITTVRDQEIKLTAYNLNVLMGVVDTPEDPPRLSPAECHHLLFPDVPVTGKKINLTPAMMKDEYRVLWYIYSRSLVQKGQSFTHLVRRDFERFASLVAMEPRDLGKWILEEMMSFISEAKVRLRATIPYPSLVSRILEVHNIWYLSDDTEVYPPLFGKHHMKNMRITFSKAQSKDKSQVPIPSTADTKPFASQPPDEAESSKPGPSSPAPSFAHAAIETIVEASVTKAVAPALTALRNLVDIQPHVMSAFKSDMLGFKSNLGIQINTDLQDFKGELTDDLDHRFVVLYNQQQEMKATIQKLVDRQQNFENVFEAFLSSVGTTLGVPVPNLSSAPAAPPPPPPPPPPVVPPPASSPAMVPPLPVDPSTVPLPSSSDDSGHSGPLFVDAKGGE